MSFRLSRIAVGLIMSVSVAGVALAAPAHADQGKGDPLAAHAAAASAPAGFSVSSAAPSSGTASGGTVLRITGSGFSDALGVVFGDFTPADYGQDFGVDSDTTIDVTTPPHAAGPVDVTVVTPSGNMVLHNGYSYGTPTIAKVDPASGPGGGMPVTITGQGLAGALGVSFGPVAPEDYGTNFGVVNDSTIVVTPPANHVDGPAPIIVVFPWGQTQMTDSALYRFVTPPAPTLIHDEAYSPPAGGYLAKLKGTGLATATRVTVDGTPATSFTVLSDNSLLVKLPAHAEGVANISVTTAGGKATENQAVAYTTNPTFSILDTEMISGEVGTWPMFTCPAGYSLENKNYSPSLDIPKGVESNLTSDQVEVSPLTDYLTDEHGYVTGWTSNLNDGIISKEPYNQEFKLTAHCTSDQSQAWTP